MKKLIVIALLTGISGIFLAFAPHPPETKKNTSYKIVGYVAGWKDWREHTIEVNKLTHINYAFASLTKKGILKSPRKIDSINLTHLVSLKSQNPNLKIIISIGGWGANYFSNAALTKSSRSRFAKSAIDFMKRFQLDGVDIDWEYPGQPGDNCIFRPEDKKNFTLMLEELRKQLDIQAIKDGKSGSDRYLLTIATGGDKEFMKHTELGIAHKYLDFINIMTYDLYNGLDKETGHHSGLYQSALGNQARNSSYDAVKGHIEAGVPVNKIVLGVPFYGRGWTEVTDKDNGLFQTSSGKHISLSYDSLKSSYIDKNGYKRYWDNDAKSPYLWNPETKIFITYADEVSLVHKAEFIRSEGLGGVMFWEYSHDLRDRILLNTIYEELNNSVEQ